MIERDGNFGSVGGLKKFTESHLSGASDVSGTDLTAVDGMKINGKTLEQSPG